MTPEQRFLLLGIIAPLVVQMLKRWAPKIEQDKTVSRLVALALVAAGAVGLDWAADQALTLESWWATFWPAMLISEATYQGAVKWISAKWPTKEGN